MLRGKVSPTGELEVRVQEPASALLGFLPYCVKRTEVSLSISTGPEFLEMALPNVTGSISVSLGNRERWTWVEPQWSFGVSKHSTEEHHQNLTALEETVTSPSLIYLSQPASSAGVQKCLSCRGRGRAAGGKRFSAFQQAHGLHFLNLAVS